MRHGMIRAQAPTPCASPVSGEKHGGDMRIKPQGEGPSAPAWAKGGHSAGTGPERGEAAAS